MLQGQKSWYVLLDLSSAIKLLLLYLHSHMCSKPLRLVVNLVPIILQWSPTGLSTGAHLPQAGNGRSRFQLPASLHQFPSTDQSGEYIPILESPTRSKYQFRAQLQALALHSSQHHHSLIMVLITAVAIHHTQDLHLMFPLSSSPS